MAVDPGVVGEDVLAAVLGGVMNPKPSAALNHLTVPVAMLRTFFWAHRWLPRREPPPQASTHTLGKW